MTQFTKKITLLLLLLPILSFAAPTQSIQLSKYYQATCANYTGTWRGFFTDPTDLFGNGGPWPVTLSFYNKGNKIIGRVSSHKAPNYVSDTMKGLVWADCSKGQLSNIFLGKPKQCGSYSQKGLLISKNVMVLEINYENAMNNAPFLLFLKRVDSQFHGKIPQDMSIAAPKTCH